MHISPHRRSTRYRGNRQAILSVFVQAMAILHTSQSALASSTITITAAGKPAQLAFRQQPTDARDQASISPAVEIVVADADGVLVPSATNLVRVNLTGVYGLGGTLRVAARKGVSTFNNLTVGTGGSYTLTASSPGLVSSTSTSFTITEPAITIFLPSSSINVGSTLTGNITLGQPASSGGASVSLTSSSANDISVSPSAVAIAAGQSTGSFTYSAEALGASALTATAFGYSDGTAQATAIVAAVPATFFGLSVGQVGIISPIMQYGTTRSWDDSPDLSWSAANPSPGVYDFTTIDDFITYYQARGADMIYTFGRTPRWASSQPNTAGPYGPGQCAPPSDLGVWDSYVKAIVSHAAGKIKNWEIWNEPQDSQYYCGDIPTMVAMAQHAAQIIKAIDPSALILSPSVTGPAGPSWLSTFLADGGAPAVDVIAFHGYWSSTAEDILSVIGSYKTVMQTNGVADKPIWDTEASWAGFGNLPTPALAQQASFLSKYYFLHWSQGVTRFVWYSYQGGYWGGLQTSSGGPSSAAIAYQQTYLWMVGASLTAPCSKNANAIWTCLFTRPGGYQAEALWITASSATLPVPPQYVEYIDLAGTVHPGINGTVTIGDQPILLENQALP